MGAGLMVNLTYFLPKLSQLLRWPFLWQGFNEEDHSMKKLSIIRFKPNPEHYDEFTRTLREFLNQRTREGVEHFYVMTKDDEVFSVGIRDTEFLQQSAKEGVEWLDGVRHMLQEYNPIDRHTIPITGDLFEG